MGKHSTDRSLRRRQILDQCRTDSELDAWMLDHFPDTKQLVTVGMDRLAKVTLLLEREDLEQIDAALSLTPPLPVQTPKSGAGQQPAAPWPKRSLWLGAVLLTGGVALLLGGSAYRNPRPPAALAGCVSEALLPCLGQNYLFSLKANDAWQVPLSAASGCKRSWIEWIRTISQECIKKDILGIRYRLLDIEKLHDDDKILDILRNQCEKNTDVMACIKAGTLLRAENGYQTNDEAGKLFVRACYLSNDLSRCSPLFVETDSFKWLKIQWENGNFTDLKNKLGIQNCHEPDECRKSILAKLCIGFSRIAGAKTQMPIACYRLSEINIDKLGYLEEYKHIDETDRKKKGLWNEAMEYATKGCALARQRDASCHFSDPQYSDCDDSGITSCKHIERLCQKELRPATANADAKCVDSQLAVFKSRWNVLCQNYDYSNACKD